MLDAQDENKEVSNIIFQNQIDMLSNLEDTLTAWLDLQSQFK